MKFNVSCWLCEGNPQTKLFNIQWEAWPKLSAKVPVSHDRLPGILHFIGFVVWGGILVSIGSNQQLAGAWLLAPSQVEKGDMR